MPFLSANSVAMSFTHGTTTVPILSDITFVADVGEVLAIRGANGCGKTTLLNLLAAIDAPTGGSIRRADGDNGRTSTGYVFQNFSASLLPWLTLRENLLLPLRFADVSGANRSERLLELKARYDLTMVPLDNLPAQSSGGQKQRTCIARAVLTHSPLVLMDEPFSALDDEGRDDLIRLVAILRSEGCLVVVVVHDLDDALLVADRILLLRGRPATLRADIKTPWPWPRSTSVKTTTSFNDLRTAVLRENDL
ncbi:MAG TPA: ATP-binding cassette domain-containing protein [Thermoanaerobaculia bacterium]|jgi:NitT/TauT family transport system ATP-binding protein